MNEFLNPKCMLTPGVAGSLMMFLVNGIGVQFPELPIRYLALFLSFLIGSIVWFSDVRGRAPMAQKGIYWVLNSLVIFVVGFGTANLAADASSGPPPATPHALQLLSPRSAYAEPTTTATRTAASPTQAQVQTLTDKLARERAENERLKRELEAAQRNPAPTPPPPAPAPEPEKKPKQLPFFKRW
jgi:hypothetical protein